jgi:transcriptional regulator of acetoin/glycerol metabolism
LGLGANLATPALALSAQCFLAVKVSSKGPFLSCCAEDEIESYSQAKERLMQQFTFNYVSNLLAKTGGNVSRSAALSGMGRASLQKIMRRLGIKSDLYRGE